MTLQTTKPLSIAFAALMTGALMVLSGCVAAQQTGGVDDGFTTEQSALTPAERQTLATLRAYQQCLSERSAQTQAETDAYNRALADREQYIQDTALKQAREKQNQELQNLVSTGMARGLNDQQIENLAQEYLKATRDAIAEQLGQTVARPTAPQSAADYCVESLKIDGPKLSLEIRDLVAKYGTVILDTPAPAP